jgi:hypothetical protein
LQINDGRLIPIKIPNKDELMAIIKVVDLILEIKEKDSEAETHDLNKKIDNLVYHIYGLKNETIKIIEEASVQSHTHLPIQ